MSDPFPITIYHNPQCGTSRNALAMIEAAGYAPQVIGYLQAGWSRDLLLALARDMDVPLRALVRDKGTRAAELGLLEPTVAEETILQAMVDHPILVNRPIVRTPRGVALCRPSERVLDLLDRSPPAFVKEDGEIVR